MILITLPIYNAGYLAGQRRQDESDNPHMGTNRDEWYRGWVAGRQTQPIFSAADRSVENRQSPQEGFAPWEDDE